MEHSKEIKKLEERMEALKQEKECMLKEIQSMELKVNCLESEKSKMAKEMDDRNSYFENGKWSWVIIAFHITGM